MSDPSTTSSASKSIETPTLRPPFGEYLITLLRACVCCWPMIGLLFGLGLLLGSNVQGHDLLIGLVDSNQVLVLAFLCALVAPVLYLVSYLALQRWRSNKNGADFDFAAEIVPALIALVMVFLIPGSFHRTIDPSTPNASGTAFILGMFFVAPALIGFEYYRQSNLFARGAIDRFNDGDQTGVVIISVLFGLLWSAFPVFAYALILVWLLVSESLRQRRALIRIAAMSTEQRAAWQRENETGRTKSEAFAVITINILGALFAGCAVWIIASPLSASLYLGSLGILFVSTMIFTCIASVLQLAKSRLTRSTQSRPAMWAFNALALILAYFIITGRYNEAPVRRLPGAMAQGNLQVTAAEHVKQWLEQRVRADSGSSNKFPVFVVAAEGGGIRAGYWSAGVLSRIEDQVPTFSRHSLALSGVSGGSVGVGIFAALIKAKNESAAGQQENCFPKNLQHCSSLVLGADLLSAPFGAMMLGDVWRSLISLPQFRGETASDFAAERSSLLEQSLERAFSDATGRSTLASPWQTLWSGSKAANDKPRADDLPFVISNMTLVKTTGRAVLTPFSRSDVWRGAEDMSDSLDTRSIAGSTALLLSARFPGISTTAVNGHDRLVDGGYSDNSGIASALEAVNLLMRVAKENSLEHRIAPTVIVIRNSRNAGDAELPTTWFRRIQRAVIDPLTSPGGMLGVLTDPIATVVGGLNTAPRIYRQLMQENPHLQHANGVIELELPWNPSDRFPLGWVISKSTAEVLDGKINEVINRDLIGRITALIAEAPTSK